MTLLRVSVWVSTLQRAYWGVLCMGFYTTEGLLGWFVYGFLRYRGLIGVVSVRVSTLQRAYWGG